MYGLSPRGRGNLRAQRISLSRLYGLSPRGRGNRLAPVRSSTMRSVAGLSPRGRGNHHGNNGVAAALYGSIPAWAGKPCVGHRRARPCWATVYPRVGGETVRRRAVTLTCAPRVYPRVGGETPGSREYLHKG